MPVTDAQNPEIADRIARLTTPVAAADRRRVVVAMSGGVDSSVVAALLHARGHDVIGITLQLYDHGQAVQKKGACCAGQDIHDARRVAERVGFPHYVLDYEDRFREAVIDRFAESYLAGETPIPCVNCNQQVKFKDLMAFAEELEADALATGHYIVRDDTAAGPGLRRGRDRDRDQSYFLYGTTRAQLARLWFPIGDLLKPEVRALAQHFGLPIADKPDSQDICFVPKGHYAETIEKLKPGAAAPGDIVHIDGRVLGRHDGIIHYTVGQRRGLGIATGDPLFVVRIDAAAARVVVGPRSALATAELELRDVNWLGDDPLSEGGMFDLWVKVRSTEAPKPARLIAGPGDGARVMLSDGGMGVARGQACVFYDGCGPAARVLGGGIIAKTISASASAVAGDTAPGADLASREASRD
ncbi:MAG: tRNA 2-thiouridine(34) synthase MnmA, partial [Pseudomonadota bacterium]